MTTRVLVVSANGTTQFFDFDSTNAALAPQVLAACDCVAVAGILLARLDANLEQLQGSLPTILALADADQTNVALDINVISQNYGVNGIAGPVRGAVVLLGVFAGTVAPRTIVLGDLPAELHPGIG